MEHEIKGFENVFDSTLSYYYQKNYAFEMAKELGYPYILWNGTVYDHNDHGYGSMKELGIERGADAYEYVLNSSLDTQMRDMTQYKQWFERTGYSYFTFNGRILDKDLNEFEVKTHMVSIEPKRKPKM